MFIQRKALSSCVRSHTIGRSKGYDDSISFTETVVVLNFDVTTGFETKDTTLEEIEAKKVNRSESFKIHARMCAMDINKATCFATKLKEKF